MTDSTQDPGLDPTIAATLPRKPLTPQQQAVALQRLKQQAEARVTLGKQLLEAADGKLAQQQDAMQAIRGEMQTLRESVTQDVGQSLQQYDQWLAQADERFSQRFAAMERRLDTLEQRVDAALQAFAKPGPGAKPGGESDPFNDLLGRLGDEA